MLWHRNLSLKSRLFAACNIRSEIVERGRSTLRLGALFLLVYFEKKLLSKIFIEQMSQTISGAT